MKARWLAVGTLIGLLFTCDGGLAAAAPMAIPFSYERHVIIVTVKVDGHGPYRMILDTDTDPSVIDRRLVGRLALRRIGAGGTADALGAANVRVNSYQLSTVILGDATAPRLAVLDSDLAPFTASFHHPIDGVLGRSFLMSRIVQIDFSQHVIRFLGAAARVPWSARLTYPSETSLAGVTVGGKPTSATIDTGQNGFVTVTYRGAKMLGLMHLAGAGASSTERGFNGTTGVRHLTLPLLTIDRLIIGQVPARVFMDPTAFQGQPEVNIGNRILERFHTVTLDFRNNTFTAEPK